MKRCIAMFVAVFASASAQMVSAQDLPLSTLPFTNSYESLEVGSSIISNPAAGTWSATEGVVAFVTNLTYISAASTPLPDETHSNVMVFSTEGGEVVNTFDTNSTKALPEIWIDTMIQPVFSEELPTTASITNSQLSICFLSTNGYNGSIALYHGAFYDSNVANNANYPWEIAGIADTNMWSTFASPVVISGQWVRLSVVLHYDDYTMAKPSFSVQLNGVPLANAHGFTTSDFLTQTGAWFRCTTASKFSLSEIALAGTGSLDDLLVSATAPVVTVLPTIAVHATGNGTITPSGVILMPAVGASTNFHIQAPAYSYIQSARTNGTAIAEAWDQESYDITWSNVVNENSLDVDFAVRVCSNGIPYEWLAANGLGTNDLHAAATWNELASGDPDSDGMPTFNEWVAGTIPTDSNSVLKIVSQVFTSGAPVISWKSSTDTLNHAPYLLEASTNLLDPNGWNAMDTASASGTGTNTWYAPVPDVKPIFYRVRVPGP